MFLSVENNNRIHFYSLILLLAAVPLAITSYLYNQSDLPKYAALVITGSIFLTLLLISGIIYFYKPSGKTKGYIFEFDKTFDPLVFLFFLSAVISTIFSLNPEVSFRGSYERQIGLIAYIYFLFIYFFSSGIFKNEIRLKLVLLVIEIIALIIALYAIIQNAGWDPFGIQPVSDKRPVSTIGNSVFAGGFLAMIFPFSILNTDGKKRVFLKVLFPLIILVGIIVTRTRSAYLAVIAELIVGSVFYISAFGKPGDELRKKYRYFALTLISLTAIIVILIILFPSNQYAARITSIIFSGNNPRWIMWQDAFNIFKKYPVFGPGVGMFPTAFEEFYSVRLRFEDILRYADNPHNNYFQVLYSMGAFGLVSYLLIIITGFRVCIRNLIRKEVSIKTAKGQNEFKKIFYLSFIAMLAGYAVYGLTNFDEITILLYLFVFLSMLKSFDPIEERKSIQISRNFRIPVLAASMVMIGLLCMNCYSVVNSLIADRHFLEGERNFASGKYADGVNSINESIKLSPSNPVYRLMIAINVYDMLITSKQVNTESRNKLLKQAADNLIIARTNHYNKNRCDAVLSLIYFEMGKKAEAEDLKRKVLSGDPVNISYRLSLAVHYIGANEMESAKEQVESVLSTNYNAMNVWSVAAYYFERTNNIDEVKKYCLKILAADPQNRYATEFLKSH